MGLGGLSVHPIVSGRGDVHRVGFLSFFFSVEKKRLYMEE